MRKKNLKPVITGSVLIIPAILLSARIGANAKSSLPKINTGSSGIKINQMKLPRMTPSTGGLKTIANKVMKTNPFKTSSSNVNNSNPNKFPVDRCNSINSSTNLKNNSNKNSITSNNDPDFNPGNTGPVYENVLTLNTSSGNKGTKPTLSPKNRPLPPIPGSDSNGGSGKRPAYNPNKGKAPAPPTNVEPYRPGSNSNKNKLTPKQNNNGNKDPIYDPVADDEPIYETIKDQIYQNIGNFGNDIYDMPN